MRSLIRKIYSKLKNMEEKCIYSTLLLEQSTFDSLINGIKQNEKVSINNSKTDFYQIKNENIENLEFIALVLWNKEEKLKFYAPKNPEYVSYSLVNIQKTEDYFMEQVDRLSNIMKQQNHHYIDLLKIG